MYTRTDHFEGENHYNADFFDDITIPESYNFLFDADPVGAMAALKLQRSSLRSLTYAASCYGGRNMCRPTAPADSIDGGFSDFISLEQVALIRPCSIFERAVMTTQPPPSLRKLIYKGNAPFEPDREMLAFADSVSAQARSTPSLPFLRAPSAVIPDTLCDLSITMFDADFRSALCNEDYRDFITDSIKNAREKAINLQVLYTKKSNFFPPFLYGEVAPKERPMYDPVKDEFTIQSRWLEDLFDDDDDDDEVRPGSRALHDPDVTVII